MRTLLLLLLILASTYAQNQENAYKKLYHIDPYFLNPAYAGIDNITQINAAFLQQWVGLKNAPSTQILSGNGEISEGLGFGTLLYNDRNGLNTEKGANLSGSYYINLGVANSNKKYRKLSFAIGITGFQHSISLNELTEHDYDPLVDNGEKSDFGLKFNLGTLLYYDNFIFGLSALGLAESTLDIYNYSYEPEPKVFYNIEMGYSLTKIKDITILPSLVYSMNNDNTYNQLDFNLKAIVSLEENVQSWLNFSSRMAKDKYSAHLLDLIMQFGIDYNNFIFSYAFDNGLSGFKSPTYGSHHISIGLKLKRANKYVLECPAY